MAVVELVDGPRDTLKNLELHKEELAQFKEENGNLFDMSIDNIMQHEHHYKAKKQRKYKDDVLLEVGKAKCEHIMESFALKAVGKNINPGKEEYDFIV
jgi:hypothetical protein